MADETIIIQYIVQADKAISDAERMRQIINATKDDIRKMAVDAKAGFKELGQSLINSFKALSQTSEARKALGDFLKIDPDTLQAQSAFVRARQEAISLIRRATAELGEEERRQAQMSAKAVKDAKAQETAAQQEYERVTKQGYGVMSAAAMAYGQQVAQVKQQIVSQSQASGQTYQQVAQQMQQAGTSARVLNSALKELNREAQTSKASFGNLGGVFQYVFGVVLGLNAVNAIRSIISQLGQLIEKGYEVSRAFFQLEVGVRAVRRAGIDITTEEVLDNLRKLNEETGNFYTQLELISGAAAFVNLIRDMGFTREQIFELQRAIITLAIVNGRSMEEVQRTVALALSSGYTEGLQRLGVSINRVNIAARANAMGWEGGYTALTEFERGQATLNLLLEKTAKYSDDLTEAQGRLFGSVAATKTAIEDTKNAIGESLLPVQLLWYKSIQLIIKALSYIPFIYAIRAISTLVQVLKVLPDVWEQASKGAENFGDKLEYLWNFAMDVAKAFRDATPLGDVFSKYLGFGGKEIDLGTPTFNEEGAEESADNIRDIVDELHADIEKAKRDYANRIAETERDLARDLEKINRDLARDLEELWRDYQRDIDRIRRDGANDEAKAITDYNNRVAEENRKAANQRADAEAKFREKEIQAEIEYQEKLRQLREEFIFDLEDALRERDARQVLQLVRRYNLEKEQTTRQYGIDTEERRRQFQLQMEEMARQRAERMASLRADLEARLAEIRAETQYELEERRRKYEQDKEERRIRYEEEKEERRIQQEERLAEMKIEFEERLAEIVAALSNEKDMTAQMLNDIGNEYRRIYGPNGVIESQIRYYVGVLNSLASAMGNLRPTTLGVAGGQYGAGTASLPTQQPQTHPTPHRRAEGGVMIADKPTTVTFGEGGIEMGEFTPLGRRGRDEGKVVYNNVGDWGKKSGSMAMRIFLSPGLEAQIVDNAVGEMADIIIEQNRKS